MKYGIIKIGGQQFKVIEGQVLTVNKLPNKEGEKIEIKEILFIRNEDTVNFGTPFIEDYIVAATVGKHFQGEKLDIYKFKSKVRYRKHIGFRPQQTELRIDHISKKGEISKKEVDKKEITPKKIRRIKTKKAA